ncbi:MAG: bifunctional DNA-binding transcriptional regulator/O6-methylguanine-DNA methyltransferase Ada [Candidatus Dactylopiibacterium sp.]|nr:bifunctional DNA-binding transcriptional regulator/O6-methylguanine-DNA methyltransferase Ada [Candidatus Dactylopiibacterium sp.]
MNPSASPSPGDEARWAAVCARDAGADGAFVYAVLTTGVYCRPSCHARRARRENVRFFEAPADAERAGFRACLRCRPAAAPRAQREAALVAQACHLIETAEGIPDLAALAARLGVGVSPLQRLFKAHLGLTPRAYAAGLRAGRVRGALRGGAPVSAALFEAGFQAGSRFYAQADAMLGMSPARFRAGGKGERIRFALARCALGALLVAASERGLCAIALGDSPEALLRDFQDDFHAAQLVGADEPFEAWVAQVVRLVETPALGLGLPLDLRGTVFQLRVWRALGEIPPGQTLSYTELARRVGAPAAVRAVASACAANRLAVAVPCHRVLRIDGQPGGYRWGLARKLDLISREAEPG